MKNDKILTLQKRLRIHLKSRDRIKITSYPLFKISMCPLWLSVLTTKSTKKLQSSQRLF